MTPPFARVAVPLPFPHPLTYELPPAMAPLAQPGVRVRVRVGPRRLIGVLLDTVMEAPEGVKTRPLDGIVDPQPMLPKDLLELARFTAEYYLAPIGEVLRAVLPSGLPSWGERTAALTNAGIFALPTDPDERTVVDALRDTGPQRLDQLQGATGLDDLPGVVERLAKSGKISIRVPGEGSAHYITAYELPPGDREAQRAACGRSSQGRAVVDFLAALGRPALPAEITDSVGCSKAVVERLAKLGVLHRFTQGSRLSLGRHRLAPSGPGANPESGAEGAAGEPTIVLNGEQETAVTALVAAVEGGVFAPFLLRGITGSGKTEVYLRVVEKVLAAGRSAILLIPEIALVPALAGTVAARFGDHLAILHSNLGSGERQQEWQRIRDGAARVVLGPRSAIFAPVANLGLVVVDEEHDSAYKQEVTPRYQGRDLALVRGRAAAAPVLLVSATPSLESRHNAERGRFQPLELTSRVGGGALPQGILVDMRKELASRKASGDKAAEERKPGEVLFSRTLQQEITTTLAVGAQVILLRNRRGYAPRLLCRACGEDMRCDQCGLPRTYHRKEERLICHYCGSQRTVPERCPTCREAALEPIGTGTERLEEDFRELFPGVSVAVLDRDAVRRRGGAAAVLERFSQGETKVLIGTQMVSKGHHFPNVALTGVMSADTYLGFPDFRAVERTYNLLTQLAGRAGRGEVPGRVVIQTFHPEHYAIQAALEHNDAAFVAEEMRFRRAFAYPPFTRMVQILVQEKNRDRGEARLRDLAGALARHPLAQGLHIVGPAPAPLERLRGKWRFQLLIRGESSRQLHDLLRQALPVPLPSEVTVDVDPQDLM